MLDNGFEEALLAASPPSFQVGPKEGPNSMAELSPAPLTTRCTTTPVRPPTQCLFNNEARVVRSSQRRGERSARGGGGDTPGRAVTGLRRNRTSPQST